MGRRNAHWIKSYCQFTAATESPLVAHTWTAVSTIAGALRRQVWLDMGFFEWTPNFYIILVGPAGVINKSTTINIGMDLLRELGTIHFGPSVVTWQAMVSALAKNAESFFIGEDCHIMSPITIAASEMGTLLDPRNREMIDVLVDLWDGKRGAWEKKTKTAGDDKIENPWINIIACTTPSWLGENVPESMIGGGFTSRCVFIYGDTKTQYIPYPKRTFDVKHAELKENLLRDLEEISLLKGPITLTEEAMEWGSKWYEDFWKNANAETYKHLQDPRFDGYRARRQTHMHKLATVISVAQRSDLVITKDDLIEADTLLTATEISSLPFVFQHIGRVDSAKLIERLLHLVSKGRITREAVLRDMLRIAEPRMVADIINGAISAQIVKQVQYGAQIYLELIHAA